MKKFLSLIVLTIILSGSLFSQDCLNDVYYTVMNQNAPGKAKSQFDKKCMTGNEGNAAVWLMKGNVYVRYYIYELELKKKNKDYQIKNPDIILEAVEAFYKALELDKNIEPMNRMLGAKEGQRNSARDVEDLGFKYLDEGNYDKAIECFTIAQRCYKIQLPGASVDEESIFKTNYYIYTVYKLKKDTTNYKSYLTKAYSYKDNKIVSIYKDMYALYLSENDTTKLKDVIKKAKRNFPDTFPDTKALFDIKMLELNYLYLVKSDSVKPLSLQLLNSIPIDTLNQDQILQVMDYLLNVGAITELETYIDQFLAKYESNFAFTLYKGDLYFKKFLDSQDEQEMVRKSDMNNSDKVKRGNEIIEEGKLHLANSHTWYEKAYLINPNDKHLVKNLYQVKKRTFKPIDPELEQRFKEIMTGN